MGVIQRAIDGAVAVISPQKALERAEARRQLSRQQLSRQQLSRQQLSRQRVTNTGYSNYGASTYKKDMAGWLYVNANMKL